jgi:hypothetical protein
MEGIVFGLAISPELCHQIPGTELRIIKTEVYPNAPALRVFFTFTEAKVHLHCIEFCEEESAPFIQYEED